jgi:hypothetical protein
MKVLSKIARSQTPSKVQEHTLNHQQTPNKPKQLVQYDRYVQELIKSVDVPPYVRKSVNKFVKGALARNASAELTNRLLETTQLAEESRERRKRVTKRVIQKGGVIEVHEACKQIRWTHNYNCNALKQRHKLIRMHHRKRQQTLMKKLVQFTEKPQWRRNTVHTLW